MARNCNCAGTCSCRLIGGENVLVSGAGSQISPYVIEVPNEVLATNLQAGDTATVDMSLFGSGQPDDPYILTAEATIAVEDLANVTGTPVASNSLVYDGTGWVYATPGVSPGAVNAGGGLGGDGSALDPLEVEVAGTWGVAPITGGDQDDGAPVYLDSAGRLRAWVSAVGAVAWGDITGKPATFPSTWSTVSGKPTTFPTTWSQVSGIPAQIRRTYYGSTVPSNSFGEDGDQWMRY